MADRRNIEAPPPSTSNFFSALNGECGGESGRADGKNLPRDRILVFGDSQVWMIDRVFCNEDRKSSANGLFS